MTPPDRSPARLSSALALVSGAAVVVLLAAVSRSGAALAAAGWCVLLLGLYRRSRRLVSAWLCAVWLAAATVASQATVPELVVLAVLGGVIGWDAGQRAIRLGRQLTTEAVTTRVELLHAGTTTAVGAGTLALAYGVTAVAGTIQSWIVVLALVVSVLLLLLVLVRL